MPGMPIVEKHAPGDFCWMELATTDHAGAKKFYSELFAWSFTESPIGPNEFYTMFKVDGRDVGAACRLDAEQQKQGVPAHWNLYVAVENADAAVGRAAELGGKVPREHRQKGAPPRRAPTRAAARGAMRRQRRRSCRRPSRKCPNAAEYQQRP